MTDTSANPFSRNFLNYIAIAAVFVMLACASLLVTRSWDEGRSDQVAAMEAVVELNAIALDSYFTQLQLALRTLGMDIASVPGKIDLDRAYILVSRFQKLHSELGNVMLIRADGQVLLTGTTPNSPALLTLGGDAAFTQIRDELLQGPPFVVGRPVMGRIDTSWVVAARYAVTDQTGNLRFILSANLPGDFLQRYLPETERFNLAVLGLIRSDGYVVSRYPETTGAAHDQVYGNPVNGAMLQYLSTANGRRSGRLELPEGEGNSLRLMQRLNRFPLIVYAEVPMAAIEAAGWRRVKPAYLLVTLLLGTVFVSYGISRRHRKKWSVAQRREALRTSFEDSLHEGSDNEIFMFNASTLRISYANDVALEHTGYSLAVLQRATILVLHPELSIESFGRLMEPLRRSEQESVYYQTNQARADGGRYPVEVHLQLVRADEGEEGILAIVNDITALKAAEQNISQFNAPVERRATPRNQSG